LEAQNRSNELDRQIPKLEADARREAATRGAVDRNTTGARGFDELAGSKAGQAVGAAAEAQFAHEHGQRANAAQEGAHRAIVAILEKNHENSTKLLDAARGNMAKMAALTKEIERLSAQGRGVHTP
jgi:hypothetical protein